VARPIPFTTFARTVLRRRYTPAQLVYAKVAFDGMNPCELEGRERDIAREIFGDVETVPPDARRVLVAYFGRDSFKSGLAIDFGIYRMATADITSCGPGEIPLVIGVSPDLKTTRLMIRRAIAKVKECPALARMLAEETSTSFALRREDDRLVGFEALAASRGGASLRGRPILLLIMDESDFFYSGDSYVKTDDEIIRAGAPRVMPGGCILAITTPWGDESRTRKYFTDNFGAPTTALVARASTVLMRDNDPEVTARVDAEMAADPDNARREFYVDLTTTFGASKMFPPDAVDACVDHDLSLPLIGFAADNFGWGVDLAHVRDSACSSIVGRKGAFFTTCALRELRPTKGNPLKLSIMIATFHEDAKPFGVKRFTADSFSREPAREYTDALKLRLDAAPAGQTGKVETHLAVKKILTERRTRIPAGRLPGQLKAITTTQTPGGGLSIVSPRRAGTHGDMASAWILSVWAAKKNRERDLSVVGARSDRNTHDGFGRGVAVGGRGRDPFAAAMAKTRAFLNDE
jgi:hypothetical protein